MIDVQQLEGKALREAVAEQVAGWRRLVGREVVEWDKAHCDLFGTALHKGEALEKQVIWVNESGDKGACELCGNMPPWDTDLSATMDLADTIATRVEFIYLEMPPPSNRYRAIVKLVLDDYWVHCEAYGPDRPTALCRALLVAAAQRRELGGAHG